MSTPVVNALLLLLAVVMTVWILFQRDMRAARKRLRGRSRVLPSPYGNVEYATGGRGADVLIVHGAGGGWDQGALIAEAVLDDRFRWIAPSRFGYLRSGLRAHATVEEQAHAYARLLDHLSVERVAVVALSAGGPSALVFALLYPHRVSSLTLISCGVTPLSTDDQAQADKAGKALVRIFRRDFNYWLMTRLFRKRLLRLMGAGPGSEWVERVIEAMHPASWRCDGVVYDNTMVLPGERIAAVRAPTLIVHAKDDSLQLHHHAAFAENTIPRAMLISFEHGGHMVLATENDTIRPAVQHHILAHAVAAAA